jgi:hypothetical protein
MMVDVMSCQRMQVRSNRWIRERHRERERDHKQELKERK